MLTDVELQKSPEIEIKQMEDLANSNFTLWTLSKTLSNTLILTTEKSSVKKLFQRSLSYKAEKYSARKCLDDLVKYRNISCSVVSNLIPTYINRLVKKYQKLEVNLVEEELTHYAVVYRFSPGSPLVDNFNKLLVRFIDVGLMSKWELYESSRSEISNLRKLEENQSNGLVQRLLLFLGCGYILAITLFVVEILYNVDTRRKIYLCRRRIAEMTLIQIRKGLSAVVPIFVSIKNTLRVKAQQILIYVDVRATIREHFLRRNRKNEVTNHA